MADMKANLMVAWSEHETVEKLDKRMAAVTVEQKAALMAKKKVELMAASMEFW